MYRHTPYIYNIGSSVKLLFCCLLGLLSVTAAGQTSAPFVNKKQGVEWYQMLMEGGMMRQYTDLLDTHRGWYMIMPNGLQDIISMNFVDGYSMGLHSMIGRMQKNRSRWELEESVFYAFDRNTVVAKGALRYLLPVEYETMIEAYGGQFMEDFDQDPVMPRSQMLMASGICGWNHYKLLEKTSAGIRLALPLTFDLKMSAQIGWERRRPKENSKQRNLFGAHAQSNDPRVGVPHTAHEQMLYEGPIAAKLAKASLRFDYKHQRSLMVMDDMTLRETCDYPTYTVGVDVGVGSHDSIPAVSEKKESFSFLALDFRISHSLTLPREDDRLSYMASAGFMVHQGEIGLADMHHFDASGFWWQKQPVISRFALLDNYDLSTDRHWVEGHVEWASRSMLFNQLIPRKYVIWREFAQLHAVKVPDHYLHWEAQYGWDIMKAIRVGVSVGFDDAKYRGTAVTMVLDLSTVNK